jgi:hypothetical protein
MDIWAFVLISLAVWRVSNMLADTDQSGPFSILDKIRKWVGVTYDEYSNKVVKPGSLADMLTCVYCNSIWVGFIFVLGWIFVQDLTIFVSTMLSFSSIAIFIQEILNAKKA